MKHPSQEEWISFLYEEVHTDERNTLARHLEQCESCQQQVNKWKVTMADLSQWEIPAQRTKTAADRRPLLAMTVVKWGIAAMLVVGISYGAGRFSASAAALGQLRTEVEKGVREQLRAELKEEWAGMVVEAQKQAREDAQSKAQRDIAAVAEQMQQVLANYEGKRLQEYQFVMTELKRLDASHAWLRRELETVALATDFGLKRAQAQLVQLASYPGTASEPASSTGKNDNTN